MGNGNENEMASEKERDSLAPILWIFDLISKMHTNVVTTRMHAILRSATAAVVVKSI